MIYHNYTSVFRNTLEQRVLSRITSLMTYKFVLTGLYAQTLQHYIFNPKSNLLMAKTGKSSSLVTSMFGKII
jgi:hypothetical protein